MVNQITQSAFNDIQYAIDMLRVNAEYIFHRAWSHHPSMKYTYLARITYWVGLAVNELTGSIPFALTDQEVFEAWQDELIERW